MNTHNVLGLRRLAIMLMVAVPIAALISIDSETRFGTWLARSIIVGTGALVGFGLAESRPRRLPRWLGRWVFQLLAMALAVPFAAYAAYWITVGGAPEFMANPKRFVGFGQLTIAGIFFGAWVALGAMIRQRDARAHALSLAFERERRELERQAVEARTQLLRSQIQPHFLFNTLANVQALVETGSDRRPGSRRPLYSAGPGPHHAGRAATRNPAGKSSL